MQLTDYQKKKKALGKCVIPYCRNKRGNSRNICLTHRNRKYREKDPIKYSYYNLMSNAKRRGKEFSITLSQFRKFAAKVEMFYYRGRKKDNYHIDRIDEEKGYTIDNIQMLRNAENVMKYHSHRRMYIGEKQQQDRDSQQTPF